MKVAIEGSELVIRLPLHSPPIPSASGKSLVVASTRGNQKTTAAINGQPVTIGVNSYIARTGQ